MFGRFTLAVVTLALAVIGWHLGLHNRWDVTNNNHNDDRQGSVSETDNLSTVTETANLASSAVQPPKRLFTEEELSQYDGKDGSEGLYLALCGQVFDVSRGWKHYGPGGGYEFFAARDGTKAFITGEFNEKGLVADVDGLTPRQMLEIETWIYFYRKEYIPVGRLIGKFYDANGDPTEALREAHKVIEEGRKEKEKEDVKKRRYPPCNSSWNQKEGSKIWCSDKSGGIIRDWVGHPRRYFVPGTTSWQCICVHDNDLNDPHMKLFEGCRADEISCILNR